MFYIHYDSSAKMSVDGIMLLKFKSITARCKITDETKDPRGRMQPDTEI